MMLVWFNSQTMGKTKGYSEVVNRRSDKTMGKTKGHTEDVNQRSDKTMGKTKGQKYKQ
jgi:hypothetical protein